MGSVSTYLTLSCQIQAGILKFVICFSFPFSDGEGEECVGDMQGKQQLPPQAPAQRGQQTGPGGFCNLGMNPFLDVPNAAAAIEYKKGYVMRKSCVDANGKRSKFFEHHQCFLVSSASYTHNTTAGWLLHYSFLNRSYKFFCDLLIN